MGRTLEGEARSLETYAVRVERTDALSVQARVRGFSLELGARRADPDAGFNPVETLLAALGDCLLTALAFVADLSRVSVERASLELRAERQDKPPLLTAISYEWQVRTDLPDVRLERILALAERNSTVFQTVSRAVPITGGFQRI